MTKQVSYMPRFFIYFLLLPTVCWGKLWIFSVVFNNPQQLIVQLETIQFFVDDDYEVVVCDDSVDERITTQLSLLQKMYKYSLVRIPPEIHSTSRWESKLHAETLNFLMAQFKELPSEDKALIVHPDLFFFRPIHISDELQNYGFAAVLMQQMWYPKMGVNVFMKSDLPIKEVPSDFVEKPFISYPDTPFLYLDMKYSTHFAEMDWSPIIIHGGVTDAGGRIPNYLRLSGVPHVYFPRTYASKRQLLYALQGENPHRTIREMMVTKAIDSVQLVQDFAIHFVGGTNWSNKSERFLGHKLQSLRHILYLQAATYGRKKH